ncbi:MAG: transporter substrate-binding domain-containing protein [Desulfobacterales bacterium]
MKNVFYAIVMFVCLVMPLRVWAETFVLGVLEDLPPFEYRENGELKGIDLEIGNEIAKRLGIEFKYLGLPWTRIKKYAEDGTDIHGILSMFRLEKYLPIVDFTEDTFISKISFFVTKESTMHISGLEDLRGKKVGVIRGYTYTPEFDAYKQMERMVFDSNDVLAKVLDKNRIEVVVAEEIPFLFTARKTGFPDRFRAVCTLDENPTCMAFSKKALGEKSRIMADSVSEVIRKMKEEGVIRNILDNYIK